MIESLIAAALLGLMGSGHCLAMCGGITMALGVNAEHPFKVLQYHVGRVISYALAGFAVGWLAHWLPASTGPWLRMLAALLMLAMAAYIGHWWMGLKYLERLTAPVWKLIQPLAQSASQHPSPLKPLLLGMLWGWLPCGMVYTALGLAILEAEPVASALTMVAFGLGTWPTMLGLAWLSQQGLGQWLHHPVNRQIFAALILLTAIWTGFSAIQMLLH